MEMMMRVEVVSRETIKPSSPTPHHLRTFKLSFIDQIMAPPIYVPVVLFYKFDVNDNDDEDIVQARPGLIKKSFSETLTKYYPLAGRIKDDNFVECNDDGVEYLETRVKNVRLSDVIQHSADVNVLLEQLLPPCKSNGSESEPVWSDYGFNCKVLLGVQVNTFACGGMAIGVRMAHKLVDASTVATFVNDWASNARGCTKQMKGPCFDLLSLFPQRDLKGFKTFDVILMKEEEIVTKKFVFGASKIAKLNKRNISNEFHVDQKNPTRVQAVSAFLWRRFMDFDQAKNGAAARVYGSLHTINMRPRMNPPLPTNTFGNMYSFAIAETVTYKDYGNDADEGVKDHGYLNLVRRYKDAINKIEGDYVEKVQTTDLLVNDLHSLMTESISSGKVRYFCFTSWCRFSLYEADFGWGKPIWVSTAKFPMRNCVVLTDTSSGDGVEAWVNMTKEDMAVFERDEELLAFVSSQTDPQLVRKLNRLKSERNMKAYDGGRVASSSIE